MKIKSIIKSIKKYHILLSLVVGVLLFPMFQEITGIVDVEQLKGAYRKPDKPSCSVEGWFSGEYQEQMDHYVKNAFSFRSFFVRIYNQINFSFFDTTINRNIIVGKNNYLMNLDFIYSYYGHDLLPKDTLFQELEKLKFVQDTLEKLNKQLVFVIAPSKPSFCPEVIPDEYKEERGTNNYDIYVEGLKKYNINYIDFTSEFKALKPKSPYLLFPPKGVHWSVYSTTHTIDSIVHYIEAKSKVKLADYQWVDKDVRSAKDNDKDVENVLNLLFEIPSDELAYYRLSMKERKNDTLKVLAIGDSFYGELYFNGLKEILPPSNEFWFYGRKIQSKDHDYRNELHFYQINLPKKINESDFIIILYNESNMKEMCYKMIDRLYRMYTNQSLVVPFDTEFFEYAEKKKNAILSNPDKMNELKIKAQQRNISLDSMVKVESIFEVENAIWYQEIRIKK